MSGRVPGVRALACVLLLIAIPSLAQAQESPGFRPLHVSIDVGMLASGGYDVGSTTAQLRGNGPGAAPPLFRFFTADSHVTRVTSPQLRVGVAVTRRIAVDVGVVQSNPRIGVTIEGDAEAPAQDLFGETLQQYLVDGGIHWLLPVTFGRVVPVLSGGGGYLRQLHEDRTLGETGRLFYAGAGARYWLRGGDRRSMALGIRGDVRVNFRQQGIDFENKMRMYPSMSLSLFLGL